MVSQIATVLSNNGLNIENMQDKSRKEMAYTLLDVAESVDCKIVDQLMAIDGVIKVRIV